MSTGTLDRDRALREISSADAARRGLAAKSLARWADADAVRALVAALEDVDPAVRDAADASLLLMGGPAAVASLVPLLRGDDAATRNRAARLLERMGKAEPEELLKLSADPDPRMRLFAANILAGTGDHDLAPRLIELLADPDLNVQDAATVGLGRMRAPAAVPALRPRILHPDPWACFSALDALGAIGTPAALQALVDGAPAAAPEMRDVFVRAIAATGLPEAAAALLDLLSRFLDVGASVAAALLGPLSGAMADVRYGTPGVVELLTDALAGGTADDILRAMDAPAAVIRGAAVEAARVRRLIPALLRVREDADPSVRAAAVAALAAFGKDLS